MKFQNGLSLLVRGMFNAFGLRLSRLTSNKVRGIDPLLDLTYLLRGKTNPTIIDVGANDGETVREFLDHFPQARVFAFEPFAACYAELKRQFGDRENVRVEQMALGATSGTSQLNLYSANRMNSLLPLADTPGAIMNFPKTGTTSVDVSTLDQYCRIHSIESIDILKLDTQGFDLEVLKGSTELLTSSRVKTLLLEVNFVEMYRGQASFVQLHELLSSFGYCLVDFYNQVIVDDHTAWCDACYVVSKKGSSGLSSTSTRDEGFAVTASS